VSLAAGSAILFEDTCTAAEATVTVKRKVAVSGNGNGGFSSHLSSDTLRSLTYPDAKDEFR
jgi:hypothetical protein